MNNGEIYEDLLTATERIFLEMVFTQVKGERVDENYDIGQELSAMVGFAGSITGLIAVQCSNRTAAAIASKMLFTDVASLSVEDTRDALGEIANMVAGNYKARYVERTSNGDLVMEQSVPTVIRGDDFETYVLGEATRYAANFAFDDHNFVIELWVRNN